MPVIRYVPQDITDLVIQGEEMRHSAIKTNVASSIPVPAFLNERSVYAPMHLDYTEYDSRLRSAFDNSMVAANACISTPNGDLVHVWSRECMINNFIQDSTLWKLNGVTRDNTGAPLGNCEVVAFETGQLFVGGAPVEGRTISDGSGNYTIPVGRVTHYEVIAYLAGSPDRAGISLRTLTPVAA